MPFLKMSEESSLSIERLNASHMREVAMVNLLYEAIKAGVAECEARRIVYGLLHQTRFRFKEEQKLMHSVAYPKAHQHQKDHEKILRILSQEWRNIDLHGPETEKRAHDTMHYGAQLLRNHMAAEDRALVAFLAEVDRTKERLRCHGKSGQPVWPAPLSR
jgi:hemerythrin-like metal-binding protein